MQVRFPKWNFSDVRAHWAPNHEFAQAYNATSTVPAYIEPYLVKVLRKASPLLAHATPKLKQDVDIFIKQEMQHCKQHIAFNKALHAQGYEAILPHERRYEADYNRFLETKSMQFNIAYCEGFEALSALGTTNFFEEFDEFYEGADHNAVELWRWHMAEEHEHRETVHEVYHAIYGHRPMQAYLYRIYALVFAAIHIKGHIGRVSATLIAKDREGMTPAEIAASKARARHVQKVAGRRAWGHIKAILSPIYQPADRRTPRGVDECLAAYAAPQAA